MRHSYPPRRTVPSPFGQRGRLPCRFPAVQDPDLRDRLNTIPGVEAGHSYTRCTYDVAWLVAEALDAPAPPEPKLPKRYWLGRHSTEFKKLRNAMKARPYQPAMVKFLGARDAALNGDDMRMGKSLETLTALVARGCKRILIITPGFARMVWVSEVLQWLGWSHFVLAGRSGENGWVWNPKTNRRAWTKTEKGVHDAIQQAQVTIVNFDILQAQVEKDFNGQVQFRQDLMGQAGTLIPHHWDGAIIDESHLTSGWRKGNSGWTRGDLIAMFTKPEQCPILYEATGTVMPGLIANYWQQLRLLHGNRVWGAKPWKFQVRYCAAGHKLKTFNAGNVEQSVEYWDASGASNVGELRKRLDHFIWGRKRREVSDTMPNITRQLLLVDQGKRETVPRPPKKGGKKAAKSRVAAYARANIRVVGPRGVQEALRSCESGHKIAIFTRYHESREAVHTWIREDLRKRTYNLGDRFRYFQIHGKVSSDARVSLCKEFVDHRGPALVLANMDAMPGGVSLMGVTENHYLEPHDKLPTIFQSEARAAEEGADNITSLFYAIPGSYSFEAYQKLLPKLQALDEVTNDSDARALMDILQTEYEEDLATILDGMLGAVRSGMVDADGESDI